MSFYPNKMSPKYRIVCHITGLKSGGAERVLCLLANGWAEKGHCVTLVVLDEAVSHYPLHPAIRLVSLGSYGVSASFWGGLKANIRRIIRLRRVLQAAQADVVIGFTTMCNITAYFANRGRKATLLLAERRNPASFPLSRVWQWLNDYAYNRADALVLQTEGVRRYFQQYKTPQYVLKNPLQWPETVPQKDPNAPPIVVSVGRLDGHKNFELLLEAFAQVAVAPWQLHIIGGDGGSLVALKKKAQTLGIAEKVHFLGVRTDVFERLSQAAIFAFPSKTEGYPNALLEAMATGLPPLSTDCDFGPADLIIHGDNGFLVPNGDLKAFAYHLKWLMSDADLREKMGKKAQQIRQAHNLNTIVEAWENLIADCKNRV